MGINRLPSFEDCWSTDKYIRNKKIKNFMTRARFQSISENLHSSNNDNDNKTDKSYNIHPVIKHLNKVFTKSLSNSPFQSVEEHICKFKGRSSKKQYIKNKPIMWGLKYWYRCDSETGYVYQLELYRERREKRELNLGSVVVWDLCQLLKDTYCLMFFDNFFSSPTLIQKLHNNGLYGLSTACCYRINMPQMKNDKKVKQGNYQCKFYNHIACIKWYDNKYVMLLESHSEEITSILTTQRRCKLLKWHEVKKQLNGCSWLDGSAGVSIPTWSKIEVSIFSLFVFWSVWCCSCQFFYSV